MRAEDVERAKAIAGRGDGRAFRCATEGIEAGRAAALEDAPRLVIGDVFLLRYDYPGELGFWVGMAEARTVVRLGPSMRLFFAPIEDEL